MGEIVQIFPHTEQCGTVRGLSTGTSDTMSGPTNLCGVILAHHTQYCCTITGLVDIEAHLRNSETHVVQHRHKSLAIEVSSSDKYMTSPIPIYINILFFMLHLNMVLKCV